MRSYLFILSSMSLALGHISVEILLCGICEIFLPMFSSRSFTVSRLIFKSFIHLEFICVWCKLVIEFHFFACSCPDIPTLYVHEAIFTPFYASPPLSNSNWLERLGFISGLSILLLLSICLFLCQYQTFLITVAL